MADNIRINITEQDLLELVKLFERLQDASQLESYAELKLVAEMKELGITATKFYKRFYLILQKREAEKLVKRVGIRETQIDEAEALRLRIQAELEAEIADEEAIATKLIEYQQTIKREQTSKDLQSRFEAQADSLAKPD